MTRRGPFRALALVAIALGVMGAEAYGQGGCLNDVQYPSTAIVPNSNGTVTTISTCSFESEYSLITGLLNGGTYQFVLASGGYITVREGTFDGPVVAEGTGTVDVLSNGADLFPHWTINDACETQTGCVVTTVQLMLNCTPPEASYTIVEDCDQGTFSVIVDVVSTGDAASVNIVYDLLGTVETLPGVGPGTYELGPFITGDVVDVSVQHESDFLCNVNFGILQSPLNCPQSISCGVGPSVYNYCYDVNENKQWTFQATSVGTLVLSFISGSIEGSFSDQLVIYDGADATGTVLFEHTLGGLLDLSGVSVAGTSGFLHMVLTSDGFGSCSTGQTAEWNWSVTCLNCLIPSVTATSVDDCPNNEFSVAVNVANTGDGSTVSLLYSVNGGPALSIDGVTAGITTMGPFAVNDIVTIVVQHEFDPGCNVILGTFTDTNTCPTLIECGTEYNETFCHGENENAVYYYQGTGTFPLALIFNSGSLETCCDRLFVYDGADINAPQLTPAGGITGDLTGQFFASTNPEHRLTVRVTTDGSVSCQSGSQIELDWTLSCLDCNPPVATFNIVQDCDNFQYFIDVNVTTLGTDPEVEITNTAGVASTFITAPGTYQIGPFVSGTQTQLTLVNDANSLCNLSSAVLVNPLCPVILCGASPIVETYCYTNNENRAWAYATPGAGTVRLIFNRGAIESQTFDRINIYDGPDANGTLLFSHTNSQQYNLGPTGSAVLSGAAPYYGVDVTTTTGNLYMTLTTDGSVSCSSLTNYDSWEWTVQCLGCQAPGVAYNLVPDCFGRTYTTEVIITQAPSQEGLVIEETVSGVTQTVTAVGVYSYGPYAQNDNINFALTDLASPGCTFMSDSLTFDSDSCVIRSCGVDSYTHCYGNNSDRWYTFQSELNVPTTINFLSGQMLTGDRIVVYNGYDETANVIYQGINGGNLAGFAVNSQNVNNAITLRIQSNDAGSCATGEATIPMTWAVGCGAVGLNELAQDGFAVYPNPTEGTLYIQLGAEQTGNVRVRVLDMSGRVVIEQPLNVKAGMNTLDMGRLQTGQYMVELTTDNWVKTQRVQVSR
ncbi:MAG: T9SS type A sorting domain-containing protein [Flavobacteriales bacterium]|nr:T9SS type A sorting domain-containing protein [Flavobacteriales bacterium]